MRLHRLTLQAFGPFPGIETIDFDALDDGILLVNGPTGSGKSSVLDAIAFALFGDVPGARRSFRHSLRSHHAHPEAAPRVELEFSIGPQRWRVERSPQWEAPKRRGTGTTTRQATVLLSQWRDEAWHLVSQRMDEAADMMSDTLGMKLDQFAQVVLLPQGEFAQFLRAKPEDRLHLLERLFDVSRFEAVETWFTEQKNTRARASQRSLDTIRTHMTVAADAVARLDDEDVTALTWDDATVSELPELLRSTLAAVGRRHEHLATTAEDHQARARQAERAVESARQLAAAHVGYRRAQDDVERWPETRLIEMRRTIDDAARVAGILRLHERATRSRSSAERAAAAVEHLVQDLDARVTAPPPRWGEGEWTGPILTEVAGQLGTLDERVDAARQAQRAADTAWERLSQRSAAAATARQTHAGTLAARDASAQRLDAATALLAATPAPTEATAALARLRRSIAAAPARRTARERARVQLEDATRAYATAETHVLDLRRRRLEGMAGELAADLVAGDPCPVCGSATHPHPATALPDVPDVAAIERAEEEAQRASAAHFAAASGRSAADERWDATVAQVDEGRTALVAALSPLDVPAPQKTSALLEDDRSLDDVEEALHALATAHEQAAAESLAAQRNAVRDEQALAAAANVLAASEAALIAASETLEEAGATRERAVTAVTATLAALPRRHVVALGREVPEPEAAAEKSSRPAAQARAEGAMFDSDTSDDEPPTRSPDVSPWLDTVAALSRDARPALQDMASALTRLDRATHDADSTRRQAEDAEREVNDELVSKGFESVDAARTVALDDDDLAELSLTWQTGVERRAAALAVVTDPVVASAAFVPMSDENRLRTRADILARRAREAATLAARWRQSLDVLESMRHQVADAVRQHLPLAEAAEEMTELAATFTGTGENTHRMRLTSYVLAAHLETVTAMANERLARMTDGRYQLRHTDERVRGTSKSGLGLLVIDAWTGRSRDTATLSGGEAFMASLALALGLGDAVRADSGGMELHTLFVDEGFGSLDQDTLEHVMEVLDGLREGGRLVGVVSHVTELRARIPTHIEVRKTAEGSTIHTRPQTRGAARIDASPTS